MLNKPVPELYDNGALAPRLDDETLLLNVLQSLLVSTPRFVAEALGRLKVIVLPAPVMVKSEPVVEVANNAAPDDIC